MTKIVEVAAAILLRQSENGVDAELVRLNKALADGVRLIQVRDKALQSNQRKQFAQAVMALAREHDNCCILVNDDATLARNIGAHGLHLSSRRLMETTERPAFARVAASCHKAEELAHAASLGLDLAVLGPVLPTASHPESHGLGWAEFGELIEKSPIPVFALGGMSRDLLETARRAGAHGIAMMRGW